MNPTTNGSEQNSASRTSANRNSTVVPSRGSGLSASARSSARSRLSAIESSDEFDSLTDLFLGEVASRSSSTGVSSAAVQQEHAAIGAAISDDAARSAEQSGLQHSFTDVAPPKIADSTAHGGGGGRAASESARTSQPRPSDPSSTLIECVVIGHVPVLASAWASQYAREVARASGKPVALLRLRSGSASVDIVDNPDAPSETDMPEDLDLSQAMSLASSLAKRWILHADANTEAQLAALPGVRLITLLTGADEAARVAGYGAVKRLSEVLPREEEHGPMIRVATVGVAQDKAAAAGAKIVEAVRHFLGRDAQQAACTDKLRSTRAPRSLFLGETEFSPDAIVNMIGAVENEPEVQEPSEDVAQVVQSGVAADEVGQATAVEPEDDATVTPVDDFVADEADEHDDAHGDDREPVQSHLSASAGHSSATLDPFGMVHSHESNGLPTREVRPQSVEAVRSAAAVDDAPVKTEHRHARNADSVRNEVRNSRRESSRETVRDTSRETQRAEVSLSVHVEGLRALPARCPNARNVEIAVDDRGRVHLLADGRGAEWNVNQAVTDLTVAGAWVNDYAMMLLRDMNVAGAPVLHLFVDEPKRARRLLDSSIRVHLLMGVDVEGHVGEVYLELN